MLSPTEDVSTFMRIAPEMNLLRWFNWHLQRGGYPRNVSNFSSDIKVNLTFIFKALSFFIAR